MRLLLVMVIMLALVGQVCGAPLEIVTDGVAKATLVVAKDDSDAVTAADEIQAFVAKMSGAKLPIVQEGQPTNDEGGVRLYVGHTEAAREAGVQIPSGFNAQIRPDIYEEEGYALKTLGNNIFIGGNGDGPYHGTWNYTPRAFQLQEWQNTKKQLIAEIKAFKGNE